MSEQLGAARRVFEGQSRQQAARASQVPNPATDVRIISDDTEEQQEKGPADPASVGKRKRLGQDTDSNEHGNGVEHLRLAGSQSKGQAGTSIGIVIPGTWTCRLPTRTPSDLHLPPLDILDSHAHLPRMKMILLSLSARTET